MFYLNRALVKCTISTRLWSLPCSKNSCALSRREGELAYESKTMRPISEYSAIAVASAQYFNAPRHFEQFLIFITPGYKANLDPL